MKKQENWVFVLGIIVFLLLLTSQPLSIYGGNIVQDEYSTQCQMSCPLGYELCVIRFYEFYDEYLLEYYDEPIRAGYGRVVAGGDSTGTIFSASTNVTGRCLKVGYHSGTYNITHQEDFTLQNRVYDACKDTPPEVEFCLITITNYPGYQRYRYVLVAEADESASGVMDGIDWLTSPIPPPSPPTEIDVWGFFNSLFMSIWNFIQTLLGWFT